MNEKTKEILRIVSEWNGSDFKGAYNIRENGQCAGRQSSENVRIESKKDAPGLEIYISSKAQGEMVYIPACVTHGDIDDLVYNDFFVEAGADVLVAGSYVFNSNDYNEAIRKLKR